MSRDRYERYAQVFEAPITAETIELGNRVLHWSFVENLDGAATGMSVITDRPMSAARPCVYEVDLDTDEASGIVHIFCDEDCRRAFQSEQCPPDGCRFVEGVDHDAYPFEPTCGYCGGGLR